MSSVQDQYEAYPYPERDPADEAKRLITGSPSDPREIDHHVFGGKRDWSKPLRALFAGGGTGDGLIQLAQILTSVGRPYDITYLDLSKASRAVAEERAKARGLTGITFHTASLMDAPNYGVFDYVDCCGVLHHLPDPAAGFAALRAAVAPDGGLGFMVYAPYGRSGVYPLQDAFGAVLADVPVAKKVAKARAILAKLPEGHPFKRNPHLVDHNQSDAGFYDLLLHSQDQAFDVAGLAAILSETGWGAPSFCEAAAYDLSRFAPVPKGMTVIDQMAAAEKLDGTMKVHVGYARLQKAEPFKLDLNRIPHLRGVKPDALSRAVAQGRELPLTRAGQGYKLQLPKASAPLLAAVNGQRTLSEVAQRNRIDPIGFQAVWSQVEATLTGWGLMLYSNLLKRS